MNPRRIMVALLAALVLSGAVTFFLSRKISRKMAAAPTQITRKYVATSRPAATGEVLKSEDLVLVEWPASPPLEGAFASIEDVAGRALVYPVGSRQPVLQAYLAPPGSGIGLTVRIPDGMRATSVHSDEIVGVAGFLFPGSRVDVLGTFRGDSTAIPVTQIVLQDVEVLTVGPKTDRETGGKPENTNVVTLLLKPEETQRLVLASTQGSIHFVLRNGADRGTVAAVPLRVAELAGGVRAFETVGTRATPSAPPAPRPYEVETIMGEKHATSQFY